MRNLRTRYEWCVAIIIALALSSCATYQLNTLNKKLYAFEVGYGELLLIINTYIDNGTLAGESKAKVQKAVKEVSQARTAVYVAKGLGDVVRAESELLMASELLKALRTMAIQQQPMQEGVGT